MGAIEREKPGAHRLHLIAREVGVHRKAEDQAAKSFGVGQAAGGQGEASPVRRLQVNRCGVMDQGSDFSFGQEALKSVSARSLDHVLVVNVMPAARLAGQFVGGTSKCGVVASGDIASPQVLFVQVPKLDAENRRLQLIEAGVHAGFIAEVALAPAVLPQASKAGSKLIIIRDDSPAITEGPQVLRRIEAKGGDAAPTTSFASV